MAVSRVAGRLLCVQLMYAISEDGKMEMEDKISGKDVRVLTPICIGAILFMGLTFNVGILAGVVDTPSGEVIFEDQIDKLRYFVLRDGVPFSLDYQGYTETPEHQPFDVYRSDDPAFWHMAVSPYYKVFFKGNTVRIRIENSWIEYELKNMTVLQESKGSQLQIEEPRIPAIGESYMEHEMVHVKHYATGQYYDWKEGHNGSRVAANLLSEMDAYRWNLMNLSFFSFDGALEEFSEQWRKVAMEYYKNYW